MIQNEQQYQLTKAWERVFEHALKEYTIQAPGNIDPRIRRAYLEGLQSWLTELRTDLAVYEEIRTELSARGINPEVLQELPLCDVCDTWKATHVERGINGGYLVCDRPRCQDAIPK